MKASRTCRICGKEYKGVMGIAVHMRRKHGIKASQKVNSKKQLKPVGTNEKILLIPCSLGGNSFDIEITLSIESSRIVVHSE